MARDRPRPKFEPELPAAWRSLKRWLRSLPIPGWGWPALMTGQGLMAGWNEVNRGRLWAAGICFALAGLTGPLAVGGFIRARRLRIERDRLAKGQCVSCGYDLQATPNRCPECGNVVTQTESVTMKDEGAR